jgi:hypothetical protein
MAAIPMDELQHGADGAARSEGNGPISLIFSMAPIGWGGIRSAVPRRRLSLA